MARLRRISQLLNDVYPDFHETHRQSCLQLLSQIPPKGRLLSAKRSMALLRRLTSRLLSRASLHLSGYVASRHIYILRVLTILLDCRISIFHLCTIYCHSTRQDHLPNHHLRRPLPPNLRSQARPQPRLPHSSTNALRYHRHPRMER